MSKDTQHTVLTTKITDTRTNRETMMKSYYTEQPREVWEYLSLTYPMIMLEFVEQYNSYIMHPSTSFTDYTKKFLENNPVATLEIVEKEGEA